MLPRISLCWLLAVLAGGLLATAYAQSSPRPAEAKKLSLPESDLEIEIPAGWKSAPPPPGAVAVLNNASGSKAATLMVAPIQPGVIIDPATFVAVTRKSVEDSKGFIVGEDKITEGPLHFEITKIAQHQGETPLSLMCTTFANDRAVTLMLSSKEVDASTDPELAAILHSLHFLSPLRPIAHLTTFDRVVRGARRHVFLLTTLGLLAAAAIIAIVLVVRNLRREQRAAKTPPAKS